MKRLIAVALAALIIIPSSAFACGMTTAHTGHTGGGGGGKKKQRNPGGRLQTPRGQWTKKRMQDLKGRLDDYRSGQRTADNIDRALGAADGRPDKVLFIQRPKTAEERLNAFRRFEFLALKKERKGALDARENAELMLLRHMLANTGGSGRE